MTSLISSPINDMSTTSVFGRSSITPRFYSTSISTVEEFSLELEQLRLIQSSMLKHPGAQAPSLVMINFGNTVKNMEEKTYRLDLHKGIEFLENYQFENAIKLFDKIISGLEIKIGNKLDNPPLKSILVEAYVHQASALLKGGQGIMDNQKAYKNLEKALTLDPTHALAEQKMQAMKFDRGEIFEDKHGVIRLK